MPSTMMKLVASSCCTTFALFAGGGVASAAPDVSRIINSTCSYSQVVAALNAKSPLLGGQLTANPAASAWLQQLIASGPEERRQMVNEAQAMPGADAYSGLVNSVASSCNNY